jgi:chromosome segregation ATPase
MEEDGGINIYAFCLNSPTDTIDAHGLGWVKRLKSAKKAARAVEVIKDLQKRRGEITKSIRSLSDKIAEHRKKLDDYVKDPDKFDHKGFLKDAPPERRQKIIDGRKKHLEGEVSEWQKQVDNAVGEVAEIDKKISALQSVACLAGTILTPYSQQLKEWQDSGVEVTPGQILSGVTLDLLSIVDPGITDLMDWASE